MISPEPKGSLTNSQFFYPVAVSEKSNMDRYTEQNTLQAIDDQSSSKNYGYGRQESGSSIYKEINDEPSFFKDL